MQDVRRILKIEVPLLVRLAEKQMSLHDVLQLAPGAIIRFEASYDESLLLIAHDQVIAAGRAVKVDERFGLQITEVSSQAQTIHALAHPAA